MNTSRKRRTKIIATLGPASDHPDTLEKMILNGIDLVRINFSHSDHATHLKRIQTVRELAKKHNIAIGILADLQGPKIRIGKFKQSPITLQENQFFTLNAELDSDSGDESQVGLDYKKLPSDVSENDILLLDDGLLQLKVEKIDGAKIQCRVTIGGQLSNNKGINRLGGGLSADFFTPKDQTDLEFAVKQNVDYIAVSFPRNADDIKRAKQSISNLQSDSGLIAKIERKEAVEDIDAIIESADAVMVARGDLGVEIGNAALPGIQKNIIERAEYFNTPVITATQMMESMITSPTPTRAEVLDVANAIMDGTDAVMLSAETAAGNHPEKVVEHMAQICLGAEQESRSLSRSHLPHLPISRIDESIAMASMYATRHLDIKAVIGLTESGRTPLWMSRLRSNIPIFALTRSERTRHRVTLYRGVYPIAFDATQETPSSVDEAALKTLKQHRDCSIQTNDKVILTKGDVMGSHGGTNTMRILTISDNN